MSNPPKLPKSIELPEDVPTGGVALGVRLGGKSIFVPWNRLGHLLIAGMTGSGKSSLLRSIAIQAIHNDFPARLIKEILKHLAARVTVMAKSPPFVFCLIRGKDYMISRVQENI